MDFRYNKRGHVISGDNKIFYLDNEDHCIQLVDYIKKLHTDMIDLYDRLSECDAKAIRLLSQENEIIEALYQHLDDIEFDQEIIDIIKGNNK